MTAVRLVSDTASFSGPWLVYRKGGRRLSAVRHPSFAAAQDAAEALARDNPAATFIICQERARTKLKPLPMGAAA